MGGSTQVVPTTNNTQQKVEIPQYLQEAGQTAVSKATDITNTPFQAFGGQSVAPLTQNQRTAGSIAANSTNAGIGFLDQARTALQGGQGALGRASMIANDNSTAGFDAGNTGAALARLAGHSAVNDNNAGVDSSNTGAALARLSGASAATNQGAGAGDLADARRYNAQSASPVSADDIRGYFNPFVQTALNPVIDNLTRSSGETDARLRSRAGMTGSFGGSRMGLQQGQNNADLLRQIATTSGDMYLQGYDKALGAGQSDRSRQGQAAGTSLSIANGANTTANDTISRLVQAAGANNSAATTRSALANDNVSRLTQSAGANTAAGIGQSQLSDQAMQRFLSLINPGMSISGENRALASAESAQANDAINRLETTGQVEQDYNQNLNNADYQQYLDQRNDAMVKLNALIAAAGGTPYGTNTDSKTQGTQVVQKPSMFGQLAGLAMAGASLAAGSDRDAKEDFSPVDDEDVLDKFRGLTVEKYRYKPEVREVIGDDGRERIGPMAQDWAKHFGGNGRVIPMPEIVGELVSAVRALDLRTRPVTKESTGATLRRIAA